MRRALLALALTAASCSTGRQARKDAMPDAPALPSLPATRADPLRETLHGVEVADPFRWLEQEKAAEVQAWMKQQDEATRQWLGTLSTRPVLAERFRQLYYVESVTAPTRRAGRFFYMRTHADKVKAILYWRDGEAGPERVLLDPNGWSTDGTVSLGMWAPSWDGKKLAFSKKPNAADEAILHVLDVDSGQTSTVDVIEGAKYAYPSWTPDSQGFYYEWLPVDPSIPVGQRPGYTELRFHALGTDPKADRVVHPRTGDPSTFLSGGLSRDGRWLFASIDRGWSENDLYVKDLSQPDQPFKVLVLGKDARYEPRSWEGFFYILTNEGASNQRLFKVPADQPARENWKEIVPEDKQALLESVAIVGGHLALTYLKDASNQLKLVTLEGQPVRTIALPTLGTVPVVNGLQDEDDAYFEFSSFTIPRQVYRFSVKTGKVDLWAKAQVPIDPEPYAVEQAWYPSKDGTRISIFLIHRKDLKRDGNNPTLLYGYGGFNVSLTPAFKSSIYPWLEAGGVYAVANLRGGGEYGKRWHDAGRGHLKQNVFDDFVAAGEWLVAQGYTRPERLAIHGGSNGGLLVGAAMVQKPELFKAVICSVPLLDMVRYHLFGSGRTWIPEYGTAEKTEDFRVLHAYSPYHHVQKGPRYPALLMLSADHDDRVDPMHARKFVAAVQAAGGKALLRVEANAGHGGADQVRKAIEQSADMYAFLFQVLGITR